MNLSNPDDEKMKDGFIGHKSEFEKIVKKSLLVISQQGFRALLLMALEKIKRGEFKVVLPPSYTQKQLQLSVLYAFVAHIGQQFGCRYVIDVGCEYLEELVQLHPQFKIIGIDFDKSFAIANEQYEFATWIKWDFDHPGHIPLSLDVLKNSIIVCANAIERLTNPTNLLENLRNWMDHAPICILSTPERDLIGRSEYFEPSNPLHPPKWNLEELENLLRSKGLNLAFTGLMTNSNYDFENKAALAVLENNIHANNIRLETIDGKVPTNFRVVAFMPVYNEEDVIVPTIKHMIEEGIGIYVIDNWSTDSTYDLVKKYEGKGVVGIERFPIEGPPRYYHLKAILQRIEKLTKEIKADWFIYQDVDEIRKSPWQGVSYRDGIYKADRAGFNCIDHTVISFPPVDNDFMRDSDFEDHFKYFAFGRSSNPQIKTWKNLGQSISLSESGGHQVQFEGSQLYPYKFLIKHYRIRSQQHGEKKVFVERKPRWDPEEKARGWHIQYDKIKEGHVFLCKPSDLEIFDESLFNKNYVIERLSGIGVPLQSRIRPS